MFLQGRVIIVWLSWLIGGICGVVVLLVIVCYCRLMPRHQKSFDEQYLKEKSSIKDSHASHTSQDGYTRVKNAEYTRARRHPLLAVGAARTQAHAQAPVARAHANHAMLNSLLEAQPQSDLFVQVGRHARPASYAGVGRAGDAGRAPDQRRGRSRPPPPPAHDPPADRDQAAQYASSGMLDELSTGTSVDALKTRSLPAFLRPKPRPLSTEDDLQQLYAKVSLSKKYKNRMRSEHAAIIALSKSRSQFFDADAVIVYDQRTAL